MLTGTRTDADLGCGALEVAIVYAIRALTRPDHAGNRVQSTFHRQRDEGLAVGAAVVAGDIDRVGMAPVVVIGTVADRAFGDVWHFHRRHVQASATSVG